MTTQQTAPQKQSYQAEVGRLLHLMVHSVYTDKEIFLRELISNASDACDKLRYEAIGSPDLLGPDERLAITITPDSASGTLMIADNGIGMDAAELADNLGTIARSGTRAFLDKLGAAPVGTAKAGTPDPAEGKSSDDVSKSKPEGAALIGQFGVGFYSAFMVADEIEVTSRKAGEVAAHIWHSDGASGFTVIEAQGSVPRGTQIRLKLKSDARQFLETHTLERIVRTYSDHILFPVELLATSAVDNEDEADTTADTGTAQPRQINSASALWQRPKAAITPEQYKEAYQTIARAYDAPALTVHYKVEGRQSYAVLLFVPQTRPFDLFDPARKGHVKLYVRRVFITDEADLMPSYLRFVRGVIDSEDVPLNISREMLQNNPLVTLIRKAVGSRVLLELEAFAGRDSAGYEAFFDTFGSVLKEGLYEDFERRDQLLGLARFRSSKGEGWRSLEQYCEALRPNQTEIYYLTGDNLDRLKASPQLEAASARGIEVLLMTDPVDSFWVTSRPDYKGKPFKSLSQGDVDLGLVPLLDTAAPVSEANGASAGLAARIKACLGDAVSDVVVSKRLVASAVCLVAPGQGPDLSLDKLLARQDRAFGVKPILEINADHPLLSALRAQADVSAEMAGDGAVAAERSVLADVARLLLDQARILDGDAPVDAALFAQALNRLVLKGLG